MQTIKKNLFQSPNQKPIYLIMTLVVVNAILFSLLEYRKYTAAVIIHKTQQNDRTLHQLTQTHHITPQKYPYLAESPDHDSNKITAADSPDRTAPQSHYDPASGHLLQTVLSDNDRDLSSIARQLESDAVLFKALVEFYGSGDLDNKTKNRIVDTFRLIRLSHSMQQALLSSMQSYNHTDAIFDLLIESEIQDPSAIIYLVDHSHAHLSPEANERLVSLIQNQGRLYDTEYNLKVDYFLEYLSFQSEGNVRENAITTRVWNAVSLQQEHQLIPLLNTYLLDHSPAVREELYAIIELEMVDSNIPLHTDTTNILTSLMASDQLENTVEKERVSQLVHLLQSL